MLMLFRIFTLSLIPILILSCVAEKPAFSANKEAFHHGWLFQKGDPADGASTALTDAGWRKVNIPHDWAIEGPFDTKYNARTGGLPVHGVAWYRKHFTVSEEEAKQHVTVFFDGVMNNSTIYLNGEKIGERPFGYMGFEVDLTPHLRPGKDNVLAVRLAPEDLASRWYSGAGIYRNVRLKVEHPVRVPEWGTYITTPKIKDGEATVKIETTVENTSTIDAEVSFRTTITDPAGAEVATIGKGFRLPGSAKENIVQEFPLFNILRWDIGSPYLYTATSIIEVNGKVVQSKQSPFGIRSIEFDAEEGFILNGKPVELKGVCMHHDLGPLGAAVNYRATERQMEIMQSMGVNALRTSHNPPSPEVLDVCDRLGIVVLDEAFDEWGIGKVPNGYSKVFDKWHERDLRDMIRRDRNHPSVIMWSIGNEILEQREKEGYKVAQMLSDICHDEDPTRPTTAGFNYWPGPYKNGMAAAVDIVGINYKPWQYDNIVSMMPEGTIFYGSETSSMTSSRGVYHLPIEHDFQRETGHVSSYDVVTGPFWAYPPDIEFDAQEQHPEFLGEFIWTGFDYLGEPTPYGGRDNSTNGYWNDDWPSKSSYFAPVDLSGHKKDRFYLYQSQWTEEPMVHVLPHWNWEGMEGKEIPVYAYTNAEEVELFVNGKSYGKKVKGKDLTEIPVEFRGYEKGTYASKYRLSWTVPYAPGNLKVVAYTGGKPVAEKEIRTAGVPAGIRLEADRSAITADGEDLSFITATVVDKDGNPCPMADNTITFDVSGAGKLEAVSNGDQRSVELFQTNKRKAFSGKCLLIVRSGKSIGTIEVEANSPGLSTANTSISTSK